MSAVHPSQAPARPASPRLAASETCLSASEARLAALAPLMWLVAASGALVFVEPSPYEVAVLAAGGLLFLMGLRVRAAQGPLLVYAALVSAGGLIGLAAVRFEETDALIFVLVTVYLAATMVVFAAYVAADPRRHAGVLLWGTVAAGVIASLAGLAGFAGGIEAFLRFDRAKGTFEDPNVMGAFLLLPICTVAMRLAMRPLRRGLVPVMLLGVLGLGLVLTLSRAAMGGLVIAIGLTFFFAMATSGSAAQRRHITALGAVAALAGAFGLLVLLSLPETGDLVSQRLRFDQEYDTGYQGRFDRWSDGLAFALSHPFGFGSLQFRNYFPEEIHNVYLNTLMAYGWIGGGAYLALVIATLRKSWRLLRRCDGLREVAVPVGAAFIATAIIGFVIDSDHWRHFFLLTGLVWGLDRAAPVRAG